MCLIANQQFMSNVDAATDLHFLSLVLMTLWLYLPGFIANTFAMMWGKWLPKTGYGPWPIDGGKTLKDGNRMLGDGKTWNGLIGGSLTAGLLCVLQLAIVGNDFDGAAIFASPIIGAEDAWFSIGNDWVAAYILGTFLGFACLFGDLTGSFFKRRQGLKREGDVSSKAPLLDTLPFAIMVFLWGQLFLGGSLLASTDLIYPMLAIIVITPVLHRGFNLIGFAIGWKDVPY
jgi:CDP-2,3-bis-(O-geranylgeranyl)-sn-glycerol synthase